MTDDVMGYGWILVFWFTIISFAALGQGDPRGILTALAAAVILAVMALTERFSESGADD